MQRLPAGAMSTTETHEHGEEALRVVLKHLGTMTPDAIAGFFDGADTETAMRLAELSDELQVALRAVLARKAHAAAVARLACISSEARKLAAAALPAPARDVRHVKATALADMVATACNGNLFGEPGVVAALVALCAAAAVPPGAAGDGAAAWRSCADAAAESLHAMPDAEIASYISYVGALAATLPGQLPALDEDPLEIESKCREWRAERFIAALSS